MELLLRPISIKAAKQYVHEHHRHERDGRQRPAVGGLWAHSVVDEHGVIRGVAIVGRPVARMLCDGWTAEVTRVATDGTRNACSMLYGAASRTARAMGYRRLLTYTLASESGTSLRAAGWLRDGHTVRAQQWHRRTRPRQAVLVEDRYRWWAPWSERENGKR